MSDAKRSGHTSAPSGIPVGRGSTYDGEAFPGSPTVCPPPPAGTHYDVIEVGLQAPDPVPTGELLTGQVRYHAAGVCP